MEQITLEALTPDQKKALMAELVAEEKAKAEKMAEDRKAYKELVNSEIPALFVRLSAASDLLQQAKQAVFDGLKTLIELKNEAYGRGGDLKSHTFTTDTGTTITIGNRSGDGWDDTVDSGLEKVNVFLDSLAMDAKSKILLKAVRKLLAKDVKGNLQSSRVLQLKQLAEESGDAEFIDGVNIIHAAYRPVITREFVTCMHKDEKGIVHQLPLDITACELKKEKEVDNEPTNNG